MDKESVDRLRSLFLKRAKALENSSDPKRLAIETLKESGFLNEKGKVVVQYNSSKLDKTTSRKASEKKSVVKDSNKTIELKKNFLFK